MISELQRIDAICDGGRPDGPEIVLVVEALDAEEHISAVKKVVRTVAAVTCEKWHSEEEWSSHLPRWFVTTFSKLPSWFIEEFQGRTVAEVVASGDGEALLSNPRFQSDEDFWEYGAWLDAMKNRGWEWWSCAVNDDGTWTAVLLRCELVASVDPLIYLMRQAGASNIRVLEY